MSAPPPVLAEVRRELRGRQLVELGTVAGSAFLGLGHLALLALSLVAMVTHVLQLVQVATPTWLSPAVGGLAVLAVYLVHFNTDYRALWDRDVEEDDVAVDGGLADAEVARLLENAQDAESAIGAPRRRKSALFWFGLLLVAGPWFLAQIPGLWRELRCTGHVDRQRLAALILWLREQGGRSSWTEIAVRFPDWAPAEIRVAILRLGGFVLLERTIFGLALGSRWSTSASGG